MKKLTDTELEIMKIIWKYSKPLTSNEILAEIKEEHPWKLASLMTVLARMADKGYVYCDRSTRTNYYTALISENEYQVTESENFLERLFNRSAKNFIASLYQGEKMSEEEIQELKEYLDSLETRG